MMKHLNQELPLRGTLHRLAVLAPELAARAQRAIDHTLGGVRRSLWPEVAWRASELTNTGYPLEFSWSSRDPAIRWTAEAAGPEVPESVRLQSALTALEWLGAPTCRALFRQEGPLRFGAWLGGRHDQHGDRYKLYVETPPESAPAFAARTLGTLLEAVPRRTAWRMAGLEPESGLVELYGRIVHLEPWELGRLLHSSGIPFDPLRELLANLTRQNLDDVPLPGISGLSLAIRPDGTVAGAAWFATVKSLFGRDEAAVKNVRTLAKAFHWDLSLYEALLGGEGEGAAVGPGRHGMIGVGITPRGVPWMQVGLRP